MKSLVNLPFIPLSYTKKRGVMPSTKFTKMPFFAQAATKTLTRGSILHIRLRSDKWLGPSTVGTADAVEPMT